MEITHRVEGHALVNEIMRGAYPIGDTYYDNISNAKLREVTEVVAELVFQILDIHHNTQHSDLASMQEANEITKEFREGIKELIEVESADE